MCQFRIRQRDSGDVCPFSYPVATKKYSGSVVGGRKSLVEFFCQDTLNPKAKQSPTNKLNKTRIRF